MTHSTRLELTAIFIVCLLASLAFALATSLAIPREAGAAPEVASYYDPALEGNVTASGDIFYNYAHTCASYRYKFGTTLYLYSDGAYSYCVVNDYGPAGWTGHSLDVSLVVAEELGLVYEGVDTVKVYERIRP